MMLLGEFRMRTERLADDADMMILISEKVDGDIITRNEVIAPIRSLDFDEDVDLGDILTVTDGDPGPYSL